MSRKSRNGFESIHSRAKLAVSMKPYYLRVAEGVYLGLRRNDQKASAWCVRVRKGKTDWIRRLGDVEDIDRPANGESVLTYHQAETLARAFTNAKPGEPVYSGGPPTLHMTLEWYADHLRINLGDLANVNRLRPHLPAQLTSTPVELLTTSDLDRWQRDLLEAGMARATINRMRNCLRACLTLASRKDKRLAAHRGVWQDFPKLPDDTATPRDILPDHLVSPIIGECYRRSERLGLFVEVFAQCGTRPSQNARIVVGDLNASGLRLLVPKSGKGNVSKRTTRRQEKVPAPITPSLAARLAKEAEGRAPHERLLRRENGRPWVQHYRDDFQAVLASFGLTEFEMVNKRKKYRYTLYNLRHTYAVRTLKSGTPTAVVCSQMDTSEGVLRKHYAAYLAHHADEIARLGLADFKTPTIPDEKVIALPARRGRS